MDLALLLLTDVAKRRYPHLSAGDALLRLAVEQSSGQFYRDDAEREEAAAAT
jgi:hypothetical protein